MANKTQDSARHSQAVPRAHEWEMIGSFILTVPAERPETGSCLLEPVQVELQPFGLEEDLLCQISSAVERAGEELRANCPEGRLKGINVRVLVNHLALTRSSSQQPWQFFLLKQMASSESDNLDAVENPSCYIDLHVYQTR